jgi:rubrerythrin
MSYNHGIITLRRVQMASTQNNLKAAFAGESQANRKYLFFAERAEKDGFPQVARLFRAVAEAETVHARKHLQTLDGGIGETAKNLEAAIDGELYESTEMYPDFIRQAESENNKAAITGFTWANKVEELHADLYDKALEAVKSGKAMKDVPYFVCQGCGYTAEGNAPDRCPVCGAPASRFKKVE